MNELHNKLDNWRTRIVCTPDIRRGEAVISGTRIPVAVIVASLAENTIDELLAEYPQLTRDDVNAALLFAAEAAHNTLVA